jgi:DNA-binding MarR family transcriptional regulator
VSVNPGSPFHTARGSAVTRLILESFRLHAALLAVGERLTRQLGTTSARWTVLSELQIAGQPRTVPQIARALGLKRQGIQRLVDALQREGLVHALPNPDHARASLIAPTQAGRELLDQLNRTQADWANRVGELTRAPDLEATASAVRSLREAVSTPAAARRRASSTPTRSHVRARARVRAPNIPASAAQRRTQTATGRRNRSTS